MYVHGIGLVGAFGVGQQAFLDGLSATSAAGDAAWHDQPCMQAQVGNLAAYIPKAKLRRVDKLCQLALLGACEALADAGLQHDVALRDGHTAIVVATGYGAAQATFSLLDSFADDDRHASPTPFSASVHNAPAATIAMLLGATGPNLTVSNFELSGVTALANASALLAAGRASQVLLGGVDEITEPLLYCRQQYFGPEGGRPISPLSAAHTAMAGEGCAFLLLGLNPHGGKRQVRITGIELGMLSPGQRVRLDNPCLLNADGHLACDALYAEHFDTQGGAWCTAPAHGSMPTASTMSLAAAVACLHEDDMLERLPQLSSPQKNQSHSGKQGTRMIHNVVMNRNRRYGVITLEASEAC